MSVFRAVSLIALGLSPALAFAQSDPTPDKSGYNILNPTPRNLLRELVTDRPDKTESPYTVDAGHFQIELDFLSYTYNRQDEDGVDTTEEDFAVAPTNFKVGLLNNLDLQIIAETFNVQRVTDHAAHTHESISGIGDITARMKVNFWGNDGGRTAFGVMPFVKIPTARHGLGNEAVDGGVIFPLAVKLPLDFDLGAMTEVDCLRDEEDSSYHAAFINSITASHSIANGLSGYAEFFSSVSTERNADWIGTLDFGFTYAVTPNVQLDTGINVGITRGADEVNPFIGLSVRY